MAKHNNLERANRALTALKEKFFDADSEIGRLNERLEAAEKIYRKRVIRHELEVRNLVDLELKLEDLEDRCLHLRHALLAQGEVVKHTVSALPLYSAPFKYEDEGGDLPRPE